MISLRSDGDGEARIVADEESATVFLDRDWVGAAGAGPLPSLSTPGASEAAGLLLAAADHIAELAGSAPAGGAEVLGDGLTAMSVRAALAHRATTGDRPTVLIDCTGDAVRLLEQIPQVEDLGVVVLAGEPLGRELAIDLYVDVHRRGLRILGAPRPDSHAPVTDETRIGAALEQLAHVEPGAAVPAAAPWFAVGRAPGTLTEP